MFVIAGEGVDQIGKTEFLTTLTKHLGSLKTEFDKVVYVKFPFKDTWYKYQTYLDGHAQKNSENKGATLIEDMISRRRLFDFDFINFKTLEKEEGNICYICDRTNITNLVYFFIEYLQIVGADTVYKQEGRPSTLYNIANTIAMTDFLKLEEIIFPKIDILIYSPYSEAVQIFLQNYGVGRDPTHDGIKDYILTGHGDMYFKQIIDRQITNGQVKNIIRPKSFMGLKDYTETVEAIMKLI